MEINEKIQNKGGLIKPVPKMSDSLRKVKLFNLN